MTFINMMRGMTPSVVDYPWDEDAKEWRETRACVDCEQPFIGDSRHLRCRLCDTKGLSLADFLARYGVRGVDRMSCVRAEAIGLREKQRSTVNLGHPARTQVASLLRSSR